MPKPYHCAVALVVLIVLNASDAFSQHNVAALRSPPADYRSAPSGQDSRPDWASTLERISRGVVAIQVDLARRFDTEINDSLQATGFVVDAKRGLILTNRHVVTPGPVTAEAVFLDREEVQLY